MSKKIALSVLFVAFVFLFASCAPTVNTNALSSVPAAVSAEAPAKSLDTQASVKPAAPKAPAAVNSTEPVPSVPPALPSVPPPPVPSPSAAPTPSVVPTPSVTPTPSVAPTPAPLKAVKAPKTGLIKSFSKAKKPARFKVVIPKGKTNYYLKLVNKSTGKVVYEFFINGGSTLNTKIGYGTYLVKYATGTTWYGRDHCFGEETYYSASDSALKFYRKGNTIYGHILTLYTVKNGNFPTKNIPASAF